MAAILPTFVAGLTSYLQTNSAKNENDTAKKIAQFLTLAVAWVTSTNL